MLSRLSRGSPRATLGNVTYPLYAMHHLSVYFVLKEALAAAYTDCM